MDRDHQRPKQVLVPSPALPRPPPHPCAPSSSFLTFSGECYRRQEASLGLYCACPAPDAHGTLGARRGTPVPVMFQGLEQWPLITQGTSRLLCKGPNLYRCIVK